MFILITSNVILLDAVCSVFESGVLFLTQLYSTVGLSRHWHLIVTPSPSHTLTFPRLQHMIVVLFIFCGCLCWFGSAFSTLFQDRVSLSCPLTGVYQFIGGTTGAVVVFIHVCFIHWIVQLTFCRLYIVTSSCESVCRCV